MGDKPTREQCAAVCDTSAEGFSDISGLWAQAHKQAAAYLREDEGLRARLAEVQFAATGAIERADNAERERDALATQVGHLSDQARALAAEAALCDSNDGRENVALREQLASCRRALQIVKQSRAGHKCGPDQLLPTLAAQLGVPVEHLTGGDGDAQ